MNRLALSLAVGVSTLLGASVVNAAAAHKQTQAPIASYRDAIVKDTDMSSHRRHWRRWHRHHHHWGHHRWRPHYRGYHRWAHYPRYYRSYGYYRPARVVRYYRPAPIYDPPNYYTYRPAPIFSIGFGFGPRFWW